MKKTSSHHPVISVNSQVLLHHPNDFDAKEKQTGKDRKSSPANLLVAMLTTGFISEESQELKSLSDAMPDTAPAVEKCDLKQQIKDRKKEFTKAASKYNRLERKSKKLQEQKADIDSKIQRNKRHLQAGIIEIESKRHPLSLSLFQRDNTAKQR